MWVMTLKVIKPGFLCAQDCSPCQLSRHHEGGWSWVAAASLPHPQEPVCSSPAYISWERPGQDQAAGPACTRPGWAVGTVCSREFSQAELGLRLLCGGQAALWGPLPRPGRRILGLGQGRAVGRAWPGPGCAVLAARCRAGPGPGCAVLQGLAGLWPLPGPGLGAAGAGIPRCHSNRAAGPAAPARPLAPPRPRRLRPPS